MEAGGGEGGDAHMPPPPRPARPSLTHLDLGSVVRDVEGAAARLLERVASSSSSSSSCQSTPHANPGDQAGVPAGNGVPELDGEVGVAVDLVVLPGGDVQVSILMLAVAGGADLPAAAVEGDSV